MWKIWLHNGDDFVDVLKILDTEDLHLKLFIFYGYETEQTKFNGFCKNTSAYLGENNTLAKIRVKG